MKDGRDLVREQFGKNPERYVSSPVHAKGASLDRIVELLAARGHETVLDVATGGGHTALAVAPHVKRVVATDLTPSMLEAARAFLSSRGITNVEFRVADATVLPFTDGEFDAVTCRIAPHHFPDVRVLRPGGVAIVVDNIVPEDEQAAAFINEFEKTRDQSHVWAYPASRWMEFFREAGFLDLHVESFFKALDFESWTDLKGMDDATKNRLRDMLVEAPPKALDALFPEDRNGALWFYLQEILIRGVKRGS
jgi:protein-L-isoaspartate O-methyltransferase